MLSKYSIHFLNEMKVESGMPEPSLSYHVVESTIGATDRVNPRNVTAYLGIVCVCLRFRERVELFSKLSAIAT